MLVISVNPSQQEQLSITVMTLWSKLGLSGVEVWSVYPEHEPSIWTCDRLMP